MTSKKIYLLRHGQTDYNLNRIVQGSGVDAPLNDTGRRQAKAFYEKYKEVPIDRIYTSSLCRTVETVQPFLDAGYSYEPLEGLNEINWGKHEGLKADENAGSLYNKVIEAWREGKLDERMEDGESPEEVAKRLLKAVQVIFDNEEEEIILICMHGRAMRILLCLLLNYPIQHMDYFPHQNTSLYQLVFTGSLTRIHLFNNLSHLDFQAEEA